MSRETDSSSPGPQGRGGAAYPSGTPPYGTRQYPSLHPQEQPGADGGDPPGADDDGPKAASSEPKTETTLTTRVRINIPGSRPIPPVVLRTPVADRKNGTEDTASSDKTPAPGTSDPSASAPRSAGTPGTSTRPTPAFPGSDSGADSTQALPRRPVRDTQSTTGQHSAPTAQDPPAGEKPPPSDWFVPRKPAPSAGPSGPASQGPPAAPYADGGPGVSPYADGGAFGDRGTGGTSGGAHAAPGGPTGDIPSPFGTPPTRGGARDVPNAPGTQPPPNIPFLSETPPPFPGGPGASGPRFGQGDVLDDGVAGDRGPGAGPGARSELGSDTVPFPGFHAPDPAAGRRSDADRPTGPTAGPATGGFRPPTAQGAEARSGYRPPQSPGAGPDTASGPGSDSGPGRGSGDTLVGGLPAVPPPGPGRGTPAGPKEPAAAPAAGKPARKGRSKPALAVVALVSIAVVAYAAGLLKDHADVPNGTSVLGVAIGGDSKQQATQALDTAVGDRANAPLKVSVGGRTQELKPSLAGLAIDTDATIQSVAHRDYNPVSVIGALLGRTHVVAPKVTVDQEKLRSQLQTLSGGSGGPSDGMVKFVGGSPVAVPGKPYQAVDAAGAVTRITDAYEKRAETGSDATITLPVTAHQPTVTQATLDQAIKTIGDPAMSGMITVEAGGRSIPFSPQKSLSKILTIVPVPGTGKMTLHIDLQELQSLYGNAFDGVLLERGNGTKTPVTPQDVASAMLPQLSKTAATKSAPIPNVAG